MSTFEDHVRWLAEHHPTMSVALAVEYATALTHGALPPLDNTNPHSVALHVSALPVVLDFLSAGKTIHAIHQIRVATDASLFVAKKAAEIVGLRVA